MKYESLSLVTALLVSSAVFAWVAFRTDFPKPLGMLAALSRIGSSRESLKALDKRLRALNIPVSGEVFAAGRLVATIVLLVLGVVFLRADFLKGVLFLILAVLDWRIPHLSLRLLEKRRKEELRGSFVFMVGQVRIFNKAADMYQALKIVPYAIQGRMGKELRLLSADLEMSPAAEALDDFAKRCGLKEAEEFARVVLLSIRMGADFNVEKVLSSYARVQQKRRIAEIKRWIKIQPIVMTVLPAALLLIFMLMFLAPMYTDIIEKIRGI